MKKWDFSCFSSQSDNPILARRDGILYYSDLSSRWNTGNLASIYLFKVNNKHIRTMWEISSELIIKTTERQYRRFGILIVNL